MADRPSVDNEERSDELVRDDTRDSNTSTSPAATEKVEEEVEDDDRFQATDN